MQCLEAKNNSLPEYYPQEKGKKTFKQKQRRPFFRPRNPWGNQTYCDLITQAILASPLKRLTLAEIYKWMTENIPYFKEKQRLNPKSHGGWKVSKIDRRNNHCMHGFNFSFKL